MKTTDSVMREFDELSRVQLLEAYRFSKNTRQDLEFIKRCKAGESIEYHSVHYVTMSRKAYEKLKQDSHSLAEARREWVEEMRGLKNKPRKQWLEMEVTKINFEREMDGQPPIKDEDLRYIQVDDERDKRNSGYNQAIDDVVDLLTGDNPEDTKG